MSKPLATDKFMRLNGRSMWVAGEAKGERTEAIKKALSAESDSNEDQSQEDE